MTSNMTVVLLLCMSSKLCVKIMVSPSFPNLKPYKSCSKMRWQLWVQAVFLLSGLLSVRKSEWQEIPNWKYSSRRLLVGCLMLNNVSKSLSSRRIPSPSWQLGSTGLRRRWLLFKNAYSILTIEFRSSSSCNLVKTPKR